MKKFKIFYDKDREQAWLNKMCEEGWAVKKLFLGMYTFEKCEKGEYIYQIDLLDDKNKKDFLGFLKENGVESVFTWGRWVTLRKKASEGSFELYSDAESKIEQYKRIRNFCVCFFIIAIINAINVTNLNLSMFTIISCLAIDVISLVISLSLILKYNNKIKNLKQQY